MINIEAEQPKILFLITEKEITLTGGRFNQLINRIHDKCDVTVASNSLKVLNHIDPKLKVKKVMKKHSEYPWTMIQRDLFAKKFVNAFSDIVFPGTDMPLWKAEGFDDYLWNVSQFVYEQVEGQYDLMIMPSPSLEESPGHLMDDFLTVQLFKAHKEQIPIVGLEVLSVRSIPHIFLKLFNKFVVKSQESKDILVNKGIAQENIFLLSYPPDNYALESLEDSYKHYLFKKDPPDRNKLNVILMNHVQMRDGLKESVKVFGTMSFPVDFYFCQINYAVKEIHESEIIRDLLLPDFTKYYKEIKLFDITELPQLLISMDAIISMVPMQIFDWCDKYNIEHLVYFNEESLQKDLERIYNQKQKQIGFADVITQTIGN